ncbi:phosphotransferase [Microbacterium terricola]|uniref:Aminoglycoside phosphotransferase domain-containing protein n=1 Tax=Microbacterium terricola TaxID=344163 RepID=A0ABM8DZ11_9MICO|nr:phosphotransferase [Microbacterium terricola]UYK41324.1 phosphotransferase [Microbacterium terricola]BDV30893.1 hypothetical protein Microterr_15530 [Microbacterium terricola]
MPDKPAAELPIDARLIRTLLEEQAPHLAEEPLRHAADGWDCSVWRLGDTRAVRLPRRALAAPLVRHEQRALPLIGPAVAATGVEVPTPVFAGRPGGGYPWSWSIVPWFPGSRGIDVPRPARAAWAGALAGALRALHVVAPGDAPVNPVRGLPLQTRADSVGARLSAVAAAGAAPPGEVAAARAAWADALAATPWSGPPVWIHGDLHPGNLIADGGRLVAMIDFGDVTAGDPAYDLAVGWLAFDPAGRAIFTGALRDAYDAATWTRARGWAAAIGAILLDHSDDNPDYAAIGAEALTELASDA